MRRIPLSALVLLGAAALPAAAHPERATDWPTHTEDVPVYRTSGGQQHVVCAEDSKQRILTLPGAVQGRNLALLTRCGFDSVQDAVDAAENNDRIYVLPGVYEEAASRAVRETPECAAMYTTTTHGDARKAELDRYRVATYEYQRTCPNARNLVAIIDDPDADGDCDKCHLQIEGTGATPEDVVIRGARTAEASKYDIVHVDRAHGTFLKNFTVEYASFNGINVIETTGYRIEDVVSRYNQNYGVLTFTTSHGLYNRVTTYGNGHAGLYPGSSAKSLKPDGTCGPPTIEMRNVESYGNTYGFSGTGANSVWVHHSTLHHNATGLSTDSTASAHPGMPEQCSRYENNSIHSNNLNLFDDTHRQECLKPWPERPPQMACPYYAAPIGTGIQILGGNQNVISGNHIYDNRRAGVRLHWAPAPIRNDFNPDHLYDTSNDNRFQRNVMGRSPSGAVMHNGVDFWWDEEGRGNCWGPNTGVGLLGAVSSDPPALPGCGGPSPFRPGNAVKIASVLTCLAWDPKVFVTPPGCTLLTPPE